MKLSDIDVNFDFTSDTPHYWDGFWEYNDGLGGSCYDPDRYSPMLRKYQQLLWSKPLPNGEIMELEDGRSKFYLKWKDIAMSSDSIIASFRYRRKRKLMEEVAEAVGDYRGYMEQYLRKAYTIGGEIIFPTTTYSVNSLRGREPIISDRWDLSMECIRRYYKGEESPLSMCFRAPINKAFFDLFVDFKGYVDFFFLQDCVSEDYEKVIYWMDTPNAFVGDPLPMDVDTYFKYINAEMEFLRKRNERIAEYCKSSK